MGVDKARRPPCPTISYTAMQPANVQPHRRAQEVIEEGDGKNFPKKADECTMHYTGTLTRTGVKFDSSIDKGKPFVFKIGIGMVIKGWDEGVMKMSLGERAKLLISSDYGYGEKGAGMVIPPNADLTFEVQLLGINGTMAPGFGTSTCSIKGYTVQ